MATRKTPTTDTNEISVDEHHDDASGVAEYTLEHASGPITVQLSADDAKRRGAKAFRPANKAASPNDK